MGNWEINYIRGVYEDFGNQTTEDLENNVYKALSEIKYSEVFKGRSISVDIRNGEWRVLNDVRCPEYYWEYTISIERERVGDTDEIIEWDPETDEEYWVAEYDFTIPEIWDMTVYDVSDYGKFGLDDELLYGRHETVFQNAIEYAYCSNDKPSVISKNDFLELCDEFDFITREKLEEWGFTIEE